MLQTQVNLFEISAGYFVTCKLELVISENALVKKVNRP